MPTGSDDRGARAWDGLEGTAARLETPAAKIALSALILLSVLPFRFVEEVLAIPLLAIFGLEFGVRVLLWRRARAEGRGGTGIEGLGLVLDLVALCTFLPIPARLLGVETHTLRLVRLFRMVLLFRYSASGARTLYTVLVRRERLRQFALVTTLFALLALLGGILVHHLGVAEDFDGDPATANTFADGLWWCVRQLESPDNLVGSIRGDPVAIVLSLGLTLTGVFLVAFVIGIGTSVMEQLFAAESTRPVSTRAHSVVAGPVERAEVLVRQVVLLFRKNRDALAVARVGPIARLASILRRRSEPVILLGKRAQPPPYLFEQGMEGVVFRNGDPTRTEDLELANVAASRRVIVLSDPAAGADADAVVVATSIAARRANPAARIYAEVHREETAAILRSVAGDRTYPFEASRFLGLFLAQHLTVPGVDRLYRETFAVAGSEFYTHIAVDPREFRGLDRLSRTPPPPFSQWLLDAHRSNRVILTGVFLGDPQPRRAVPVERLAGWMNPLGSSPDPRVARLGGAANQVPWESLRGFVGLCPTHAQLQAWVRRLIRGEATGGLPGASRDLPVAIDDGRLARMLVLGDNAALPALLRETARRRGGLATVIATEIGPSERAFAQRMSRLPRIVAEKGDGWVLEGERGARTTIVGMEELSLRKLVREPALDGPPFDAVVFLSDPAAQDPDARTSFRVLRFLRRLEDGTFSLGSHLHVLAEIGSESSARSIEEHLAALQRKLRADGRAELRYTILSTDRIKNYFLAHGALIPGLIGLYDELLGEEGPELVRLVVPEGAPWTGPEVSFDQVLTALAPRRLIPLALELRGERDLVVNPSPALRVPPSVIRAVYAIGEAGNLRRPP